MMPILTNDGYNAVGSPSSGGSRRVQEASAGVDPSWNVDDTNDWIGDDIERAQEILDSGETRKGVLGYIEDLLDSVDDEGDLEEDEDPVVEEDLDDIDPLT